MNRDAIYSLTAIVVLIVAVIGLIFVRTQIMADVPQGTGTVMGAQSSRDDSIPLKIGWNYFVSSDFAINQKSEIIEASGKVFSINEALAFGLIDGIIVEGSNQKLISDVSEIPPGSGFEVHTSNIDNNPAVVLK